MSWPRQRPPEVLQHLVTPERLLEASFEFLLEREPRESIMRSFELPIIGRSSSDAAVFYAIGALYEERGDNRRHVVSPNDNLALRACAAFTGDVLIVESQYDAIVPHPVSESYAVACAQARSLTCSVIANADHGLSEYRWRNEYTAILTSWIGSRMARP